MKKVNPILFLCMPLLLNNAFLVANDRFEDTFDNSQQVFNFANNLFTGFKNALPSTIHDQILLNYAEKKLFTAILYPEQHMLKNGRFKKDAVNTIVNAAIVGYAEGVSYKTALATTRNTKIAETVSESMEAHIVLYLGKYNTTSNKEITEFIANKLSLLLSQHRKATANPEAKPSTKRRCPVCSGRFETEVTRRLLKCGDSICTDCAPLVSSGKCPTCGEKTI